MLSAAKHLLYLIEKKPKQILRSAQDDMSEGFSAAYWGWSVECQKPSSNVERQSYERSRQLTENKDKSFFHELESRQLIENIGCYSCKAVNPLKSYHVTLIGGDKS